MATVKKTENNKCLGGWGDAGILGGIVKWFSCCGKVWRVPNKLKIEPPCNLGISLLGTYPKEVKAGSQRDICTSLFIAAPFTVAKMWKQPVCPSKHEWKNKIWCIHVLGYSSALKRKELWHATICMSLEDITLSEINQSPKDRYCMILLVWSA